MISEAPAQTARTVAAPATPPVPAGRAAKNLYLTGRPKLKQFLRFVRSNAVAPADEGALTDEWNAACRRVRELETAEAGLADHPTIVPLDKSYEPLLVEFLKDPLVRGNFNTVPTDVALVELDRLVVYQKHLDLTFAETLRQRFGRSPGREDVFRACLPFDHPHPPVQWARLHRDSFVFVSPSNDLRFLHTLSLQPGQVGTQLSSGSLVGAVGAAVGFSINFLMAVCAEGRVVLTNGSHRAYALRSLGVTHAPCVVQHVSSREELDVVASEEVREHPDQYLKQPRPS
ncbi:MAG: hypothetical protein HY302_11500, partial [Opitutae bacterium]|nr:hypothetical protein [Opitutae bacterium]